MPTRAWIPCSKRLPEQGIEVEARIELYGNERVATCLMHGHDWVELIHYPGTCEHWQAIVHEEHITHWRPIPTRSATSDA